MNKIILIFYPPIITVELPVKTVPSLGAISPNALLIYSAAFVMKFVIGFNDSVTDKSPPAGSSLQLVPNSQFKILSPSYLSHLSHSSYKSHNRPCGSPPPLAQACSLCPIHNSQFTIHNSQFKIHNSKFTIQNSKFKIQNSKFKIQNSHSHYRLKKRLFLWWVKGNSRAVLSNSFVFSY